MSTQLCATTEDWVPVIAAFVAAGAAIVVGFSSVVWQWRAHRQDEIARRDERTIAILLRKLDMYGKILALLGTNEKLRATLKRDDRLPFRLVAHIREFKDSTDEMQKKSILRILKINRQIRGLIEGNASLIPYPMPDSFGVFLHHQRGIEDLWESNNDASADNVPPYPRQFNVDVAAAIEDVYAQLSLLNVDMGRRGAASPKGS